MSFFLSSYSPELLITDTGAESCGAGVVFSALENLLKLKEMLFMHQFNAVHII